MEKITYVKNKDEQSNIYTNYILDHMDNVRYAYKRFYNVFADCFPHVFLNKELNDVLYKNIINHDKSKLDPIEFEPYAKHFYPVAGESITDQDNRKYELAWLHHMNHNPHHPGYWVMHDVENNKAVITIYDMDDIYIIEMLCDWLAMGHYYGTSIQSYWESDGNKLPFGDKTKQKIQSFMNYLKNNYITTLW